MSLMVWFVRSGSTSPTRMGAPAASLESCAAAGATLPVTATSPSSRAAAAPLAFREYDPPDRKAHLLLSKDTRIRSATVRMAPPGSCGGHRPVPVLRRLEP